MRAALLALAIAAILSVSPSRAAVPTFTRHVLRIAEMEQDDWSGYPQWVDLNGDGLRDAMGILPDGRLYVCWQRKDGFGTVPDQVWRAPADTAWVTPADVSKDPGLEIVVSTGRGWFYYPQRDGRFATEPVPLLDARQVYADATVLRPRRYGISAAKDGLPAQFEDHTMVYKPVPGEPLDSPETIPLVRVAKLGDEPEWWVASRHWNMAEWSLGDTACSWLFVDVSAGAARKDGAAEHEQEKDAVDRFYESLRKDHSRRRDHRLLRQDLNGDGKPDALLWQTTWGLDTDTVFYVFLADAQGHFSDKPDQRLPTAGMPVGWSPLIDVTGDGRPELLTVEPRNAAISLSFAAEVLVSGKLDARICFRTFDGKGFSRRPVFRLDVSTTVTRPRESIDVAGDFNGDGRKDLLVWRSPTQVDVYFSRTTGDLYERQPSLTFETPPFAEPSAIDLNGDKIADVVFASSDSDEFVIYLSNPPSKEGPAR